jgi:hypothetical protein
MHSNNSLVPQPLNAFGGCNYSLIRHRKAFVNPISPLGPSEYIRSPKWYARSNLRGKCAHSCENKNGVESFCGQKTQSDSGFNDVFFQLPDNGPYLYWYPNPTECRDVCNPKRCNEYYTQLNNYNNCNRCQLNPGRPMCWNPKTQQCYKCSQKKAMKSCTKPSAYGTPNPNGWPHREVGGPINPKYTGCY